MNRASGDSASQNRQKTTAPAAGEDSPSPAAARSTRFISTLQQPRLSTEASKQPPIIQTFKPHPPLPLFASPSTHTQPNPFPDHHDPDPQALTNPYHRQTPEEHRAHHARARQLEARIPPSSQAPRQHASSTSEHQGLVACSADTKPRTPLTSQEYVILFRLLSTCRRPGSSVACFRPLLAPGTKVLLVRVEDVTALREVQVVIRELGARERQLLLYHVRQFLTGGQGPTRRYVLELLLAEGKELEIVGRHCGTDEERGRRGPG